MPRAILVGERYPTRRSSDLFRETANRIVAGTDVESPSTVLQDVDPTSNLLVFQAPRVGFERTTHRLIPISRHSTIEQVLANPTRRFQTLDLSFACHCGTTCRVWLVSI